MNKKIIDSNRLTELVKWKEERERDRDYSARQYDQLIVYLSGGGLVITTGFATNLLDLQSGQGQTMMILSWVFFTSALVSNLISQVTARKALEHEINITTKELKSLRKGNTFIPKKATNCLKNFYNWTTRALNFFSLIFLLTGIILYLLSIINTI